MKISYRLYLTVAPAILGVLLIAGLFYWGQYAHVVPHAVLLVGVMAVLGSLILAGVNARILARRIEHLASRLPATNAGGQPDELDRIAHGVDRLSTDARSAAEERADQERALENRTREYAALLAGIADDTAKRLEEVRLPLHILLENHFGDLNENQEEMLGAARTAAEAVDADLVSLRQIGELDLGDQPLRRDRMKPSELIEALRPMLVAAAESVGAAIEVNVAPLLPAIMGDRARLQDALAVALGDAVRSSPSGSRVQLRVDLHGSELRIDMSGIGDLTPSVRLTLAARVVAAHGGTLAWRQRSVTIEIPMDARRPIDS
ncbi:MAG TPA: hypothetical protein VGM67_08815 [Gemmatimonadaceae bacterium]